MIEDKMAIARLFVFRHGIMIVILRALILEV